MMFAVPSLLLQVAATAPAQAVERDAPIVITATRLADGEQAIRDCVARGCPPDEDARLSLAQADSQFIAGAYNDARRTLKASLARIGDRAKEYPVPIGTLWRAHGRISVNMGEGSDYRWSMKRSATALRTGLGDDDPRTAAQRVEATDAELVTFGAEYGRHQYAVLLKDAEKRGQQRTRGQLLLRIGMLDGRAAGGLERDYRRTLQPLTRTTEPELAVFREAATLLIAMAGVRSGSAAALETLLARQKAQSGGEPRLLSEPQLGLHPSFNMPEDRLLFADDGLSNSEKYVTDQWVDVAFWITPEGLVRDVEVVRRSPRLRPQWIEPMLGRVAARRYAPLALDPSAPGILKVQRFTRTALWGEGRGTGGGGGTKRGRPRIEVVDLTRQGMPKRDDGEGRR